MKPEDIKLIIWDLDETFWRGTFTEGEVMIPEDNIKFLHDTLDMGIIHSICSKNDFFSIKEKLVSENLWECFVFPSIDWTPKGGRIKEIIETMKLRPDNVIFIDDNLQNLAEVKYVCPKITTISAKELPSLVAQVQCLKKRDTLHKRLEQYQQMERKESARIQYQSNEDFLYSCDIRVEIKKYCVSEIDRIHELILRSNQLNYTKFRQSKEELLSLLTEVDVSSGYVTVSDKFGDYGLVGFFAVKNKKAIHYVFSCRTLGMRVEQFVYNVIGFPELEISGDVASEVNKFELPGWINQSNSFENKPSHTDVRKRILFKGPCDMSQMYTFLNIKNSEYISTEFTYMNDNGISVEGHNHTAQIVTALYTSKERKQEICDEICFFDSKMLDTSINDCAFDVIVLSMLTDGNLGVYRRKSTGEMIAFGEKKYPLDSSENKSKYINGEIFTSMVHFNSEIIDKFSDVYEFVDNSDFHITLESLDKIYRKISLKTTLILLLGAEKPFSKNHKPSYENRHVEHKIMNDLIRKWSEGKKNVRLLFYDDYISSDADFLDTINHFSKKVYYEIAKDIISAINFTNELPLALKGRFYLFISSLKQRARQIKNMLIKK